MDGEVIFSYTRSLLSCNSNENPWLASVSKGSIRKICTPPQEVVDVALKGAKSVGAFYDSLDILMTMQGPVIIEHNLTPNYSSTKSQIEESKKMIAMTVDKMMSTIILRKRIEC